MVVNVEDYEWSNYKEYLIKNRMTDVNFVFDIFNKDRKLAIKSSIEFVNKQNEDICMDIMEKKRITDEEARIVIEKYCKIDNTIDLQKLDIPTRNLYLK